ncbi:MAG: LacI family transcriptional regulator [Phycisphaerales bacterium]|jgi:LacI family transcriptional regulator
MSSVRKIAKDLGISVATVSRALNNHPDVKEATRQAVLDRANQTGYAPTLGKRLTNIIGLVYPTSPVRADYGAFESAILAGILRGVDEQRFDVTIINLSRDKRENETYTQFFMRKGIRGVVVRTIDTEPRLAEAIAEEGFPCLAIAEVGTNPKLNYICSDSRADSVRAVEHLIMQGHRRIALGHHVVLDHDHRERLEGYLEGLQKHGIPVDESLMFSVPGTIEGGSACVDRMLRLEDPATAVYLTTPLMTMGALHRCLQHGLHVPDDLSVVGFDDAEVRKTTFPPFTAVCQDAQMMGLEAARWLTRRLRGLADEKFREKRPTYFDINRSTGHAPKKPARLLPDGTVVRAES